MPQELDEKKHVIVPILDNLRPFNPNIGSYDKSMLTDDFDYSVKLSNGRMRLPEELITDFERSPSSIGDDRYKVAATKFVPNETPQVAVPQTPKPTVASQPTPQPAKKKNSSSTATIITILLLLILGGLGYYGYTSSQQENVKSAARVNIYSLVAVEGSTYNVNQLLGGISNLRVTVTNNSDYILDIVKVKVSYMKADGSLYKNETLYFNKVGPHSTTTLHAPNSERGTSAKIETESISCSALNM